MSYEDMDLTQEPRKVFVNFLILNINQVEQMLYFSRSFISAVRPLRGLIGSLNTQSQEKLEPQLKQLQSFEANINLCSRETLEQIYREVLRFLHATYLKEIQFARPKHPSENISVPNVSKKTPTPDFKFKKPVFK